MHTYLPAIGFGEIKKKSQLQQLLTSVKNSPDQVSRMQMDEETNLVLISREIAPGIGIAICGEEDLSGNFQMEYYYPYVNGEIVTTDAECSIMKDTKREAFNGICDDMRLGLNLIFSITNFMEYRKYKLLNGFYPNVRSVCLTGLCSEGKVILPLARPLRNAPVSKKRQDNRIQLIQEAKKGSQDAIDTLAIEEINLTNRVGRMVIHRDLYTLIESFIMPFGMECDQYTIFGEIQAVRFVQNSISQEKLYDMDVLCNDMLIRVVVNAENMLGEPMPGRRFKGDIWLQGTANYI